MQANNIVKNLLTGKKFTPKEQGAAFAPVNFALIKYWGKRNALLNLPVTSSLSLALPEKGAFTRVKLIEEPQDKFILNQQHLPADHPFTKPVIDFLDLVRPQSNCRFEIETHTNLPIASGLATSACGFSALTLALNELFNWQLTSQQLSILARLGSGSACRSLWPGFVTWHAGNHSDGMDSYAEPMEFIWDSLCIGLLILHPERKILSSRLAMQKTVESSCYYPLWPDKVAKDMKTLTQAISEKDFPAFGRICESNALAMHASMLSSWPPIFYSTPKTLQAMQKVWQLREEGFPVYFTQDAGPNLKLLFLAKNLPDIQKAFNSVEIVWPFTSTATENHVVMVDENDRAIGTAEKLFAHQQKLCHRAFSVFVFRKRNQQLELLIQQRQHNKYHCGGLWTNSCCSHPRPGEGLLAAATRRLKEEVGIEVPLHYKGQFHYIASFDNQLTENEIDHVFVGYSDTENFFPDVNEIADLRWVNVNDLKQQLIDAPHLYTPWLKQALEIAVVD